MPTPSPISPQAIIDPQSIADIQAIEQQRQVAQALLGQGLHPDLGTQMAGNVAIRRSPLEGLAAMLKVYAGQKNLEDATQKSLAMNQRYADALRGMFGGATGTNATNMQNAPNAAGPPSVFGADLNVMPSSLPPQTNTVPQTGQPMPPMAPNAAGMGGMNLRGMTPQQSMLAFALAPDKYWEGRIKQTEPLINRGYGLNVFDPATGTYNLDPGSLAGIRATEEAKANIAASNKMITVPTANGPRMMTEAQAIRLAGGNPGNGPSSGALPAMPAAAPSPNVPARSSPPGNIPATSGGPGISLMTPQTESAQRKYGENLGNFEEQLSQKASSALNTIRTLDEMRDLTANFTPGKLANAKALLSAYVQGTPGLGKFVSNDEIKSVGSVQDFNKLTAQLAGAQVKEVGNRPMLIAFQTFLKSNPNPELNPYAMSRMIDFMRGASMQNVDKYQDFAGWKRANPNGTIADFEGAYNRKFLGELGTKYSGGVPVRPLPTNNANLNPGGANPAIDALLEKYK